MTGRGRPKKTVPNSDNTVDFKNETEELKQKLADLQKQLERALMKEEFAPTQENNETRIPQDDYIKVMALRLETMNLSTAPRGKGKTFVFNKFGEIKNILYADLVQIIETHPNFVEGGYFYILDKRVIRRHGFEELYSKILTKEKIEQIVADSTQETVDLFAASNREQQETIINIIVSNMLAGAKVDLNIVDRLSRISGIKIQERVDDITQLNAVK
jgi:hypothetical protein